jgi:SAM-dependent methyltransferase
MRCEMKKDDELFEKYGFFWDDLHEDLDFELTAKGYGEWYHDCLPNKKEAPILDVGCGSGHFLYFLQLSGYTQVEGIDLSAQQIELARKKLSCPVHQEDASSFVRNRQRYYQLIALNDFLEHIPKNDIVPLLKTLRSGLAPDGVLVVNTPQAAGLTSIYIRYNDFTHRLVFTELSLSYLLRLAGFSEVRFVRERWPYKFTPRHLAYRTARWVWFRILKLIYFIELPGMKHPGSFHARIFAVAKP